MKSNIIAYTGTHGTGKTTSVYRKAYELKKESNQSVGIILETARHCPFPIFAQNQEPTVQTQLWIFTAQLQKELEMSQNYNVVVADRSVVDCIAYSAFLGQKELVKAMSKIAKEHSKIYRQIIFRPLSKNNYNQNDNLRHQDESARKEIEDILAKLYLDMEIPIFY